MHDYDSGHVGIKPYVSNDRNQAVSNRPSGDSHMYGRDSFGPDATGNLSSPYQTRSAAVVSAKGQASNFATTNTA